MVEKTDESLTDEEKLTRYRLGEVHFGVQYDVPSGALVVRIIEARDLPLPVNQVRAPPPPPLLARYRKRIVSQCLSSFVK